jgi:nitrogen PTS system EIIA component
MSRSVPRPTGSLGIHHTETRLYYGRNGLMSSLFILQPEAVATVRADNKSAILAMLADRFCAVYELDFALVLAQIEQREKLGSTGFGRGVAIPHARVAGLNRPVAAFLRLEAPVLFDAADAMPVDLVFGLLSPENAGATHLHALAAISRMMRDEAMHSALIQASDAEVIYGLLCNVIDRDAA